MERPGISVKTGSTAGSIKIDQATENFIGVLDRDHTPEELKRAFDNLVSVMTFETFRKIKARQEVIQLVNDSAEEEKIEEEINKMKEDLIKSVSEIAMLADNYQKE
ncbi:MAG: hypothetical protein WCW66_03205 [Patescibacteria group bacterium]